MNAAVVARWISVIGGSVLLVLGTLGGVFNIVIFTHRSLNKCAYSSYMLAAAFFDLAILDHPLVLRILADGFGIDPISKSNIYCKIRFFTGQISSFVPIKLICLAAIDRWAKTCRSVRLRQWSSIRTARIAITITILFWAVASIPTLIVNEIAQGACRQVSKGYGLFLAFFFNPVLFGILPVRVLAGFGYATYVNVRQVTHRQHGQRSKIDEQLARALILQCGVFIISQIFYTAWNLYLTLTANEQRSPTRASFEALFTQFTRLCFYFNYVSTFCINLAAPKHIRRLAQFYLEHLFCQRGRIHPTGGDPANISMNKANPGRVNGH